MHVRAAVGPCSAIVHARPRRLVGLHPDARITMPSSFAERLAARAGRPTLPPSAPAPAPDAEAVVAALRRDLNVIVEPAIARLRRSEERRGGSDEECFRTAAGRHLRYRCCVYFTALAAGLLEQRYGLLAAAAPQLTYLRYSTSASSATTGAALPPYDGGDAVPDAGGREAPSPYGAMARWLLQPSAGASSEARARAELLMAQAERAMDGYNVRRLGAAAGQLPGPVGRYEVALRIGGVTGTLWRCEVSTVHTFLLFSAARMDDVIIDVTYKQVRLRRPPHRARACSAFAYACAAPRDP